MVSPGNRLLPCSLAAPDCGYGSGSARSYRSSTTNHVSSLPLPLGAGISTSRCASHTSNQPRIRKSMTVLLRYVPGNRRETQRRKSIRVGAPRCRMSSSNGRQAGGVPSPHRDHDASARGGPANPVNSRLPVGVPGPATQTSSVRHPCGSWHFGGKNVYPAVGLSSAYACGRLPCCGAALLADQRGRWLKSFQVCDGGL